ncbi:hypothetical protein [Mycobacterium leprae]|uniref:hypothetical protein n=1 Tax=Mycobacterium leprae TaxID=1769 RepID=UPI00031A814B|nr:hypothetical protein [Mycobacterium leprae]
MKNQTTSPRPYQTFGLRPNNVDPTACTDAKAILGIDYWDVGGIQITVGKPTLYTA